MFILFFKEYQDFRLSKVFLILAFKRLMERFKKPHQKKIIQTEILLKLEGKRK